MKKTYGKLGGQLGLGCIVIGLVLIGLAWNGAAGVDFVSGQIPYLLSGGAFGLSLVILGVGLIVVQNSRKDRSLIEAQLRELNTAISRLTAAVGGAGGLNGGSRVTTAAAAGPGANERVVVGRTSFHRPDCRLVQGKDMAEVTVDVAVAQGLSPCRICNPAVDLEAVPSPS
jgi:hypothetical protein